MRLPFLQMESDLLAHGGPELATLAGCSVPAALGHIAMVRAWAVSMADDSAPPDGFVPGEAAGRRIEAAAQWTGERGRLLQALQDAGQVRAESDGIRVLHLEPYAKAWGANHTSKQRMRKLRERSANTDEHLRTEAARSAKFGGQTQTQTQTQKTEDLPASQESAGAVPEREELRLTSPTSKRKARTPSRAEELFEALQLTRKQRCDEVGEPWVEEKWSAVFQNTRLKAIVADTDDGKARFEAAWGLYLADDGERVREPAWSLAWFLSPGVRARYETRAAREGAA